MSAIATILVADDDDLIRSMLDRLLRRAGYRVLLASDGAALLHLVYATSPDLVLTDVEMPRLDGLTALRQLRADTRTAALPTLVMSAHVDLAPAAIAAGADGFVEKPFLRETMLAHIAAHLPYGSIRP